MPSMTWPGVPQNHALRPLTTLQRKLTAIGRPLHSHLDQPCPLGNAALENERIVTDCCGERLSCRSDGCNWQPAKQGGSQMDETKFVIPAGKGATWQMAPGRSAALKITSDMAQSVMMFEEVAPTDTVTDLHIHHDSDEIAYVVSGEVTFRIGDQVTVGGPGTCAFMPRGLPHAWKSSRERTRTCSVPLHAGKRRQLFRGGGSEQPSHVLDEPARNRHGVSATRLGGGGSPTVLRSPSGAGPRRAAPFHSMHLKLARMPASPRGRTSEAAR